VLNDGYYDEAVEKIGSHRPSGPFRGGKYSLFEAGTRVPFITYWKGKIQPLVSDALVSQLDLLTSLSRLVGSDIKTDDSMEMLDILLGNSNEGRNSLVIEATTRTALRSGNYIMIPPYNGPEINNEVNIELGNSKEFQLYNLKLDEGQKKNIAKDEPGLLEKLIKEFEGIRGTGYGKIQQLELK
jgi:arylsulfatase A-like enzyme